MSAERRRPCKALSDSARSLLLLPVALLAAACSDSGGCLDTLAITTTASSFFATEEFSAQATWSGSGSGCPATFTWQASAPLTLVGLSTGTTVRVVAAQAGTGSLSVSAGSGAEFTATRSLEVRRNTGNLAIAVSGLEADVPADIELSLASVTHHIVGDTVVALTPGNWRWRVRTVVGGTLGHRWVPVVDSGTVGILRSDEAALPVSYRRVTSEIDFLADGVPAGLPGAFLHVTRVGGDSFDFVTSRQKRAVEPGHYTWTATDVEPSGYWFVPRTFSGEFDLPPDFSYLLSVSFDAQRGFLDIHTEGLPPGVVFEGTLLTGTTLSPTSLPGAGYRTPADYALDVPDLMDYANLTENRFETYKPLVPTRAFTLRGGETVVLTVAMYLAAWWANFDAALTVTVDRSHLAPLIGFGTSTQLRATIEATGPPAAGGNAQSLAGETIAFSAPTPWVIIKGTIQADSSFSATGIGTVAGYPNTPVTLNGRITSTGGITGTLFMGSDTPPTGLPGGAVQYSVQAPRISLTQPPR